MRVFNTIEAWGHPNVTAKNKTTLEVTKEDYLTRNGDCILAIKANSGVCDLSGEFKQLVRRKEAKITATIQVGPFKEVIRGRGDPNLTLVHPKDIVLRKSDYISDRTLMIGADKAAVDLSRDLVKEAQKPWTRIKVTLIVEV